MAFERRRFVQRSALLLMIVAAAVGLWIGVNQLAAAQKWKALEREVRGLMAEAEKRGGPRPTFHPDAEPGNAFDDYTRALVEIEDLPESHIKKLSELFFENRQDRRALDPDLLTLAAPALNHLREGARKAEFQYRHQWTMGDPFRVSGYHINPQAALCGAAIGTCHALLESRKVDAALDLLLDTAIFARDLCDNGFLYGLGYSTLGLVCEDLVPMLAPEKLSREKSSRIDQVLACIEDRFPLDGIEELNVIVLVAKGWLEEKRLYGIFNAPVHIEVEGPMTPGLSFAFSRRLMEADAIERLITVARRKIKSVDWPWSDARRSDAESRNYLRQNGWTSIIGKRPLSVRRRIITRLRLLRMATNFLATGDVRPLPDPFGKTLLFSLDGPRLRAWSIGEHEEGNGESIMVSR